MKRGNREELGPAPVQAQLFEGMPFQFSIEVEWAVSASGICRFICLHVCVCLCACWCECVQALPRRPYHLLTHLLPFEDWASPLLMPPHQSQIQPQLSLPFPCLRSPPPVELVWHAFNSPTLPLYHVSLCCPSTKNLAGIKQSLGGKFMQLGTWTCRCCSAFEVY